MITFCQLYLICSKSSKTPTVLTPQLFVCKGAEFNQIITQNITEVSFEILAQFPNVTEKKTGIK